MEKIIERYLKELGYTNIWWEWGRKGWFIIASHEGGIECIDFQQITKEIINAERGYYYYDNVHGKKWCEGWRIQV